jgi:hypothetical protein
MTRAERWRLEWRMAMIHASLCWPGTTISDGAFDVLRQVAEYQAAKIRVKRRRR